jgi:hypothetical protein
MGHRALTSYYVLLCHHCGRGSSMFEQSPGRKKAPAKALSLDALAGQLLAS